MSVGSKREAVNWEGKPESATMLVRYHMQSDRIETNQVMKKKWWSHYVTHIYLKQFIGQNDYHTNEYNWILSAAGTEKIFTCVQPIYK